MRGNPWLTEQAIGHRGSIPAHAGQPTLQYESKVVLSVYPRACGATFYRPPATANQAGLSPRMRGNLVIAIWMYSMLGSIPAHAGQPLVKLI